MDSTLLAMVGGTVNAAVVSVLGILSLGKVKRIWYIGRTVVVVDDVSGCADVDVGLAIVVPVMNSSTRRGLNGVRAVVTATWSVIRGETSFNVTAALPALALSAFL